MKLGTKIMDIQGAFANDKLQPRFGQAVVATAKWMATVILIAWIIFCLAVSILTFLAGTFPGADAVAAVKSPPVYQSPTA